MSTTPIREQFKDATTIVVKVGTSVVSRADGTLAIGRAGAINAALLAASVISLEDDDVARALDSWRANQTDAVADAPTGDS